MGHTNYWYTNPTLNQKKFNDFADLVEDLFNTVDAKNIICSECNLPNEAPIIRTDLIRFNGKGEAGHETFLFLRKSDKESIYNKKDSNKKESFNFCKTNQKPYDKYVVACLIIAKYIFGNDLKFLSDGRIKDLEEGKVLAENIIHSKVVLIEGEEGVIEMEFANQEVTMEQFVEDINKY